MKNPLLRRGMLIALLALSLTGNLWQFLARSTSNQDHTPERKPPLMVEAVDTAPATESTLPVEKSGDASLSEEQPSEARGTAASGPAAELPPLAERRPVYEHPEDWIPSLPTERVKLAGLRAMLLEQDAPADRKVEVSVIIKDRSGVVADFGTSQWEVGQKAVLERSRDFPYPARFDPPQAIYGLIEGSFPISPAIPVPYIDKETGWKMEISTAFHGAFIMLEGAVTYIGFAGFESAAGIPFSPIEDENGVLITDNRRVLPKFTTYEMPFIDAVQFGETLQMPVHSPDGEAVLEITVRRVSAE